MSEADEVLDEITELAERRDRLGDLRAETFEEVRRLLSELGKCHRKLADEEEETRRQIYAAIREYRDHASVAEMCEAADVDRAGAYKAWERMSDAESAHSDLEE